MGPPAVSVELQYGPASMHVTDEKELLTLTGLLLQKTTPFIEFEILPITNRLLRLPSVRLPHAVIHHYMMEKQLRPPGASGRTDDKAPVLRGESLSSQTAVEWGYNGRLALSFESPTHGPLMVTSFANWEDVRELLVEQATRENPSKSSEVLLHAELVVLWFDGRTIHALNYDNLLHGAGLESVTHILAGQPDSRTGLSGSIELGIFGGSGAALPSKRAVSRDPSPQCFPCSQAGGNLNSLLTRRSQGVYTVMVSVDDILGHNRGEVRVPLMDPPLSRQELLGMVRTATGIRAHRSIRLAYCLLPGAGVEKGASAGASSHRVDCIDSSRERRGDSPPRCSSRESGGSCTASNGYGGEPAFLGPLKPLENDFQVNEFMLDLLDYGCRTIHLVVAEVAPTAVDPLSSMGEVEGFCSTKAPTALLSKKEQLPPVQKSDSGHIYSCASTEDGCVEELKNISLLDTVIVQYEVEPTALWVSGPITVSMLENLTKAIKVVCEKAAEKEERVKATEKDLSGGGGKEGSINSSETRIPKWRIQENGKGQKRYFFDLQDYTFSKDEEVLLENGITQVMQTIEGLKKLTNEDDNKSE